VLMRATAAGVAVNALDALLLTHLHSDHIADLGDLIITRWVTTFTPSPAPLQIIGPPGTAEVVSATLRAFGFDIGYRIAHHDDFMPGLLFQFDQLGNFGVGAEQRTANDQLRIAVGTYRRSAMRIPTPRPTSTPSPAAPRNTALDLVTGRYVFFLDADDHLGHEALERLVATADENGSFGRVEFRHPFFDLRLLRYLLAVPAMPWCRNKLLIRTAMRGSLPAAVVERRKTTLRVNPDFQRVLANGFPKLVPVPALAQYVDPAAVPSMPRSVLEMRSAMRPLGLNHWLQNVATN